MTVDIANPFRYKVLDIVQIFEKLLSKKAPYEVARKEDQYMLDLASLENFIKDKNIAITLGEDYLINKLKEKLK
jgi:hypothetical protein